MKTKKGKTYFTQPFRTKINAKNKTEAKDKLLNFILGKMTVVIVEEKDYNKTDVAKLQKNFDQLNEMMNKVFKN